MRLAYLAFGSLFILACDPCHSGTVKLTTTQAVLGGGLNDAGMIGLPNVPGFCRDNAPSEFRDSELGSGSAFGGGDHIEVTCTYTCGE